MDSKTLFSGKGTEGWVTEGHERLWCKIILYQEKVDRLYITAPVIHDSVYLTLVSCIAIISLVCLPNEEVNVTTIFCGLGAMGVKVLCMIY